MSRKRLAIAITGASGAVYGTRLVRHLAGEGHEIFLTISAAAAEVINHELKKIIDLNSSASVMKELVGHKHYNIRYFHFMDVAAPIASGSFKTDGMAIVPCSMGTIGRIASGASLNLIERAADVCLKERRKLVVVPRETPYSLIHLRNMTTLTEAGAVILPASPGFYSDTNSVDDLINFVLARILDHLGVENRLSGRYGDKAPNSVDDAATPAACLSNPKSRR